MKNINSNTKESVRDYWRTPQWFVDQLENTGKVVFVLDPCANGYNHKAITYINESEDGLTTDWLYLVQNGGYSGCLGAVFVNPPFSQMDKWIDKIIEESNKGLRVFMVHPDTSDTAWFQKIEKYCTYQLVPTSRLNYLDPETGDPKSGVNFQSCVSVFTGISLGNPPRVRFKLDKPSKKKSNSIKPRRVVTTRYRRRV